MYRDFTKAASARLPATIAHLLSPCPHQPRNRNRLPIRTHRRHPRPLATGSTAHSTRSAPVQLRIRPGWLKGAPEVERVHVDEYHSPFGEMGLLDSLALAVLFFV